MRYIIITLNLIYTVLILNYFFSLNFTIWEASLITIYFKSSRKVVRAKSLQKLLPCTVPFSLSSRACNHLALSANVYIARWFEEPSQGITRFRVVFEIQAKEQRTDADRVGIGEPKHVGRIAFGDRSCNFWDNTSGSLWHDSRHGWSTGIEKDSRENNDNRGQGRPRKRF